MARTIWTLRVDERLGKAEKPTSVPRAKPMLPPMAKPAAARSRLMPRSRSRLPDKVSFTPVSTTLLGAGITCGGTQPDRARISQASTASAGASQDSSRNPRGPMVEDPQWSGPGNHCGARAIDRVCREGEIIDAAQETSPAIAQISTSVTCITGG